MNTNQTPEEIAKTIFYSPATNGKAEESIKKGAELIERYSQSLSTEIENLIRWKAEQMEVMNPIFDYMRNHKEMPSGESMTKKIIEFAKERDELKLKLSGKTSSCPVCDSMAERNRELEKFLQDLYRHYELGNTIDCKIEQLLSKQNNKK